MRSGTKKILAISGVAIILGLVSGMLLSCKNSSMDTPPHSEGTEQTIKETSKAPHEYTYAEFEVMSPAQQMAFQNSFDSMEAFDEWLQNALFGDTKEELPWENGGKQPVDYTYEEFDALPPEQQLAFQYSFQYSMTFDEWLEKVQKVKEENLWNDENMNLEDITWEEFDSLTGVQQIEFQNYWGAEKFEDWYNKNCPD